ncbi:MAG TPA: hypothetical protein EYH12_01335 [Psychromonas hadalis]|nr:hypothetical protein [Psychromonas hadalis]
MKKLVTGLTVVALTVATTFVQAAEQKVSGFYLGGTVGQSGIDYDYSDYSDDSDSDSGFALIGGYQFNRVVGIEVSYTDHGKFSGKNYEIAPSSFAVAANLAWTFSNGIRPYALVGLSAVTLDESATTPIF